MAKPKVTEWEVRFARSLLARVGGNQQNTYVLLALIAWLRAGLKAGDSFFRKAKNLGYKAGGAYIADKLLARAKAGKAGYGSVLKTLRRGGTDSDPAVSFFLALYKTSWDAKDYGYVPAKEGYWLTRELPNGSRETIWVQPTAEKNPLLKAWAKLTGSPIPSKWFQDTVVVKKTVKKVIPRQPRSLQHARPDPGYLQPYAAAQFYDARPHMGMYVLEPDDA